MTNSCRRTVPLPAMLMVGLAMCASARGQQRSQTLIPANFTEKTDSQGFRWDIAQNGYIQSGTNHSLSSALTLTINSSSFSSRQRMMTSTGDEYVLSANIRGLDVTRRIKVDTKAAAVRYVEVLHNPAAVPTTATVVLQTSMNRGPLQTVTTDSGMPFGSVLGPKDMGLIGLAQPGQGQVSCLFYLADTRSKIKPAIRNESNYRFYVTYTLTIPAGKTVAILHGLAQRHLNTLPDSKTASALFKPFKSRSWIRDLPADIRRSLVNAGGFSFGTWGEEISATTLETLDVEPGTADILAAGDGTRLRGVATCGKLSVETRFGAHEVPFDRVAAVVGERFARGASRVFLRDGQVLRGPLELTDLRFTMNTGVELDLTAEHLDRLVLHADAQDGQAADDVFALLETSYGDRLALVGQQRPPLSAATPWGERDIPLDEILQVSANSEQIGHRLMLKDGSRLFAFLGGPAVSVQTQVFGVQEFDPRQVRSLIAAHVKASEVEQRGDISTPYLVLAGENVLVGQVDLTAVHFLLSGQRVPVPPNQIRVMRNLSDGAETTHSSAAVFEAELWDGGNISGELGELVLSVRSADRVSTVRVQDIEEIHVPSPTVPDTLRVKIARFLRDLGDPEFRKRDAASKGLAEVGYLAKSQLNETLSQTTDPEVRRRVLKLLDDLPD